jgi:hypothetical protein
MFPKLNQLLAGAARGIRTPDPIITNDVLYQLSYCGVRPVGLTSVARPSYGDTQAQATDVAEAAEPGKALGPERRGTPFVADGDRDSLAGAHPAMASCADLELAS